VAPGTNSAASPEKTQSPVDQSFARMEEDYRLPRTILSEALSSTPRLTPEEIKRWQETIIENKHYAAIGRAAVSWAFFESIVDGWSLNIAGIHLRPGLCFTAQIYGIGRKLETFISLARLRQLPSTLVVKLEDFYRRAKGAGGKRDRIVHDICGLLTIRQRRSALK
jgi:hypothetical protein